MLLRLDGNSGERRQAEIFTILRRAGWRGAPGTLVHRELTSRLLVIPRIWLWRTLARERSRCRRGLIPRTAGVTKRPTT